MGSAQAMPRKDLNSNENTITFQAHDVETPQTSSNEGHGKNVLMQENDDIGDEEIQKPKESDDREERNHLEFKDNAGIEINEQTVLEEAASDTESEETEIDFNEIDERAWEKLQDAKINEFRTMIEMSKINDTFTNKESEYTKEVTDVVSEMNDIYFFMDQVRHIPLTVKENWNKRVATVIIETQLLETVCEIVKLAYPGEYLLKNGKHNMVLVLVLQALQNYSDASEEFAINLACCSGFCEKIKEMLQDNREGRVTLDTDDSDMVDTCLSIVHNLSMQESNITFLREVDFLPHLTFYLDSKNEEHRLLSLAAMAALINEEESSIIRTNTDMVVYLLDVFSNASKSDNRDYRGWSCKESALIVRNLSRNDANKKVLADLGVLELLVNLGKNGNQDEQNEAVSALWALSFDVDNRMKIVNDSKLGVIDLFIELKFSEDKRIRKVCEGALWTLQDSLKESSVDKYKRIASQQGTKPSHKLVADNAEHVMISYAWTDQKTLIQIKDDLKASGVKVWIDIDHMEGSTVESMATAIEQAKIVLMCMSQKYKDSPNCRAEAEYAYKKQKPIVPLKLERGYEPDGWLGFICGAKLFFDFSGKYKFDDKFGQLRKEIAKIYARSDIVVPKRAVPEVANLRHVDEVDSRASAYSGNPVTMATTDPQYTSTIETIKGWKVDEMRKWIEENDLNGCGVEGLTGIDVALLMTMYQRAPEYFFKCLQETLKVKKMTKKSKLVWALDDLIKKY